MDPFTGALILTGLNAGMGAIRSGQQARQRKQQAEMRAAEIESSPWTGRDPSTQVSTAAPSVWAEMGGGAINALGQTAALQNAGLFKTGDVTPPMSVGPSESLPAALSQPKKSLWDTMSSLSERKFA